MAWLSSFPHLQNLKLEERGLHHDGGSRSRSSGSSSSRPYLQRHRDGYGTTVIRCRPDQQPSSPADVVSRCEPARLSDYPIG